MNGEPRNRAERRAMKRMVRSSSRAWARTRDRRAKNINVPTPAQPVGWFRAGVIRQRHKDDLPS